MNQVVVPQQIFLDTMEDDVGSLENDASKSEASSKSEDDSSESEVSSSNSSVGSSGVRILLSKEKTLKEKTSKEKTQKKAAQKSDPQKATGAGQSSIQQKKESKNKKKRSSAAKKLCFIKKINPDVMLFLSYYMPYKENTRSGWNEEKIREESMNAYKDKEGTSFKYLNCLDLLKDHPKYNVDTSGTATAAAEAGTNNTSIVMGGSLERPLEKKAQKMKQNKTLDSCASSIADTKHSTAPTSSLATAVADSIDRLNNTFIMQGKKQETETLMDSYLKSAEMYMKMDCPEEAKECMNKWKQACLERERNIQGKKDEPLSFMFSMSKMPSNQDHPVPNTITTPTRINNDTRTNPDSESDDMFVDTQSNQVLEKNDFVYEA